MDPRNIEAIQRVVQAGIHIPSPRLDRVLERRHAGLPDEVPASITDPAERHRFAAAQQLCTKRRVGDNKGVG